MKLEVAGGADCWTAGASAAAGGQALLAGDAWLPAAAGSDAKSGAAGDWPWAVIDKHEPQRTRREREQAIVVFVDVRSCVDRTLRHRGLRRCG